MKKSAVAGVFSQLSLTSGDCELSSGFWPEANLVPSLRLRRIKILEFCYTFVMLSRAKHLGKGTKAIPKINEGNSYMIFRASVIFYPCP
jgi:hypothetical protein